MSTDTQTTSGAAGTAAASPGPASLIDKQLGLLRKRLESDPKSLRQMFLADGASALAWEFDQEKLGADFIKAFWEILLRDDGMSTVLQRFVWNVPLKYKRKFIQAVDEHLSDRYPMFKGLSQGWPGKNSLHPYIRPADERATDFGLVNQGFLGYIGQGYSAREVDLFVWLEVLRDKQCDDRPCEVGLAIAGKSEPKGGCPVKIHIPEMLNLLGTGRFRQALELIEGCNPLPNVTGRVCPQELQCQGVCTLNERPIEIGQLEWFLPEREKLVAPNAAEERWAGLVSPWVSAEKPPIAVVGSGPAGLINAYLLAAEGFPVTVFEAFHDLGGVLRYGIPEFRLPNTLIDDVVRKITLLGGKFVRNFVVGKMATIEDLKAAGFWKIFIGTGAGLPRFMNVPGEHLQGVMSANEFLTRVNLMQGHQGDYETPLPEVKGKQVIIIGGGNTAMDAARTARRLGGNVTIVYRRTQAEMPARVEELHHALEEGIVVKVLRGPREFVGDNHSVLQQTVLDVMDLGPPDASGRRSPVVTGQTELMNIDLAIMALGNDANPIVKDAEPELKTSKWGTIEVVARGSQKTSIEDVYHRRRRRARRLHGHPGGRRRTSGGARNRRRDPVHARANQGARRPGRALHRTWPDAPDHPQEDRAGRGHRRVRHPLAADRQGRQGRSVRARACLAEGRAYPAHAGRLGRREGHDHARDPGHGHQFHRHQQDEGGRRLRRHRRAARPAQQAPSLRGRPHGGVHRGRRRPAAGVPDHARAPAPGQPRHLDLRFPHVEPAVLDRRERARRSDEGGVRGSAGRDLHQQ